MSNSKSGDGRDLNQNNKKKDAEAKNKETREGWKKKESERRRSNLEFCKTKFQFIVFKSEIIRSIVACVLLVRVHLGFIFFGEVLFSS